MTVATETNIETETKTDAPETGGHWPPLAHLLPKGQRSVKPGDKALCGAKLIGIPDPDSSWPVCTKCIKIANHGK